MKRYLFTVIFLASSMLCVVTIINFFVDPGAVYFKRIAKSSFLGLYADTLVSSKYGLRQEGWKERDVKLELVKHTNAVDCVILGSSHVMNLSTYQIGGLKDICKSVMNLSVSGGSIEDLAIFTDALLEEGGVKNKKALIGVDPWTLNFDRDFRYSPYADGYNRLKQRIDVTAKVVEGGDKDINYRLELLGNLISFDYFHESISLLRRDGVSVAFSQTYELVEKYKNNEDYILSQVVPKDIIPQGWEVAVTLPDGGHVYSSRYIAGTVLKKHQFDAERYKIIENEWLDKKAIKLFLGIIELLKKSGYEVVILLTPYHPSVWESPSGAVSREAMMTVSEQVATLAHQRGVELIGSYDPKKIGCSSDEFFDFMHARPSCLDKIFRMQ